MTTSTTTIAPISNNSSLLSNYVTQQQTAAAAAAAATAASSSSTSAAGLSGNFNTFLNILTTQLKYQDPTAATDTNQFTQELVEFSGVEQQLNTNSDLQTLINLQKNSSGLSGTLGYMNQYVEAATTTQFPLQSSQAELAYTLPSAATSVSINVTDSTGATVATLTGPTAAGLDRVAWDGKNSSGTQLADGVYNFQLTATDAAGSAIAVTDTRAVGLVTGLQSNSDGTISLSLGAGMTVNTSAVDAVYSSSSLPTATLGDPSSSSSSSSSSTTS
jgi:flagellar basal-body rod modification protein FlgD